MRLLILFVIRSSLQHKKTMTHVILKRMGNNGIFPDVEPKKADG